MRKSSLERVSGEARHIADQSDERRIRGEVSDEEGNFGVYFSTRKPRRMRERPFLPWDQKSLDRKENS